MNATASSLPAARSASPQRFSELLEQIAEEHQDERIGIGDLLHAMQGRAIAALLFIFAFPNILPTPPGVAAVLGLPSIFLSFQLMLGTRPWLPSFIAKRSMTTEAFRNIVRRAAPVLSRAENLLKERWSPLTAPLAQRLLGLVRLPSGARSTEPCVYQSPSTTRVAARSPVVSACMAGRCVWPWMSRSTP